MTDIRCPMCGKPNPAELEVCQFCQARLKPLSTPQSPAGDEPPDWLKNLRGKEEEPAAPSGEPAGQDEGSNADWLDRIRERSKSDLPEEPPSEPADLPDWLRSDAETPAPSPVEPARPASDNPDWLLRLRAREEMSQAAQPGEEAPEWLKNLTPETPASAETPQPAESAGEENVPDWLQNLSVEPARQEETPDWMKSFTPEATQPEAEQPGTQEPAPESFSFEAETPAQPSEGIPDWLKSFAPEAVQPEAGQPGTQEPAPESFSFEAETPAQPSEGIPDWLKSFAPEAAQPEAEQPGTQEPAPEGFPFEAETPAQPSEGVPDWLKSFAPEAAQESAALAEPVSPFEGYPSQEAAPSANASEEMPDWLSGLTGETQSETPSETPAEPVAETPDWLKAFGEQSAAVTPEEPAAETPQEVPDWMKTFTLEPESGEPAETTGPVPGETAPLPADEIPEWLSQGTGEPAQMAAEEHISPAESEVSAEEIAAAAELLSGKTPDWLQGLEEPAETAEAEEAQPTAEEPAQALAGSEIPDWLSEISPASGEAVQAPEPAAEMPAVSAETADLSQSDLPGWVKAMRPVEAAVPQPPVENAETEQVEKSGPLAGLAGVLPGGGALPYSKPPLYSMKLQVTEAQQMRAALLDDVLAGEGQPVPAPAEKKSTSSLLLRGLVALVLLVAALIPLFLGSSFMPIPESLTPEAAQVFNTIETLPADSTVLLVADYTPSLAGEMDAAAATVVEHLMNKGANIAIFSTVPLGPVMGENLITTALRGLVDEQNPYVNRSKLFNLGFLPGGAAALQQFAASPSAALTRGLDSTNPWTQPALQKVQTLADFDQVILVTDDPDLARAWVEQTGSVLKDKPLAVIASAQAAPLISPYVDAGQVRGMVAGMAGGAAYEQVTQRPLHSGMWDSYQAVLVTALVLILLGALVNGLRSLLNRRKPNREATR